MATAIFAYFHRKHVEQQPNDSNSSLRAKSLSTDYGTKFASATPIIQKTWGELMKDKENVGQKVYQYVMQKEITLSRMFLKTNINAQSAVFMMMMDKVVGYLDDEPSMDSKLLQLGKDHVNKFKVKTHHYKHFRSAFLRAIKQFLPWSDQREEAWQIFWERIITQMTRSTQENHYPQIRDFEGRTLSEQEMIEFASLIHSSFNVVLRNDPSSFAKRFYKGLLSEHPDIAKLFDDKNTTFDDQAARFMAMMMHAVKMLDDTNTFTESLESLSAQHVGYGVEIPMLDAFGKSLIAEVKQFNVAQHGQLDGAEDDLKEDEEEELDFLREEKWGRKHDDSWKWFWSVVVGVMSSGMKKVAEERALKKALHETTQKPATLE